MHICMRGGEKAVWKVEEGGKSGRRRGVKKVGDGKVLEGEGGGGKGLVGRRRGFLEIKGTRREGSGR